MAKVRGAKRVELERERARQRAAERPAQPPPPVGSVFGGLLLAFVGGAVAMLAWDASRIPAALLGTRWEEAAAWTTRLAVGVPSWVWTLVLFLASSAVAFGWMVEPARRRRVVVWGATALALATIGVLAHGMLRPVDYDQFNPVPPVVGAGEPAPGPADTGDAPPQPAGGVTSP
jgi:hypothetical protein